jgi:serine O-acetyltransferase
MLIELVTKVAGGIWSLKHRSQSSRSRLVKGLSVRLYKRALQAKGSWISESARFAGTPCFPHGLHGIFISGGVAIGRNCVIFQHVTIGSNTLIDSSRLGAPVIGDNCYIGAGAKIIGKVSLGRNVRVGANAVVVRDVPDNSVVTAGEQRVMTREVPLNNRFYQKRKGRWRCFDDGKWCAVVDAGELELLDSKFSGQVEARH